MQQQERDADGGQQQDAMLHDDDDDDDPNHHSLPPPDLPFVRIADGGVQHPHVQQQPQQPHRPIHPDERAHLGEVCRAYRQYARYCVTQVEIQQPARLVRVPESLQQYLPEHLRPNTAAYRDRLLQYRQAAIRNQFCLDCILRHAGIQHSQQELQHDDGDDNNNAKKATESQFSKVTSVLKSLARDWSVEGKVERDMAYLPILQSISTFLPLTTSPNNHHEENDGCANAPPRICVPGAGVGRLACELAAAGYTVQGNEFSLYMLLASDFVLNSNSNQDQQQQQPATSWHISPWLLETRNVHDATDPLRVVHIPDVDPYEMVAGTNRNNHPADFSMAAGEFCSIYSNDSEATAWDAVVACFFLDTSPVLLRYLEVMHHMLKPGGYLVSFGPLHWHWSGPPMDLQETVAEYRDRFCSNNHITDERYLDSIDFCWQDVETMLHNVGFEIVQVQRNLPALYTADVRSMLRTEFQCVHLVARKRAAPEE
jgi:carnosine N-methyltransferase